MYIRCPNCRHRFFATDGKTQITPRQRKILETINEVARGARNGAASTLAIAQRVNWAERTVRYELNHLAHMGEVERLNERGGWRLVERPVMMVA